MEILGSKGVVLNMTAAWMGLEDERKYNKDVVESLLRARLLALAELDNHLSKVCVHFCIGTVCTVAKSRIASVTCLYYFLMCGFYTGRKAVSHA